MYMCIYINLFFQPMMIFQQLQSCPKTIIVTVKTCHSDLVTTNDRSAAETFSMMPIPAIIYKGELPNTAQHFASFPNLFYHLT